MHNSHLEKCELYNEDFSVVLQKAIDIAENSPKINSSWIERVPLEKKLEDGNSSWIVLNTNQRYLGIFSKKIPGVINLNGATGPCIGDVGPIMPDITVPGPTGPISTILPAPASFPIPDDPLEETLPAGWTWNGKPITVIDLQNDPYSVKYYSQLSEKEKIALVTARLRKRPSFLININGVGTIYQKLALEHVTKQDYIGQRIVTNDIVVLSTELDYALEEYKSNF